MLGRGKKRLFQAEEMEINMDNQGGETEIDKEYQEGKMEKSLRK